MTIAVLGRMGEQRHASGKPINPRTALAFQIETTKIHDFVPRGNEIVHH